jgi:hypothetical protein
MIDSRTVGDIVVDCAGFISDNPCHDPFSRLRREQPVCWDKPDGYRLRPA